MKKGTTFGELMIVLLIVSASLIIFLRLSVDYLRSLVFARELFILNNILYSKYQFLIAYRNKALESPFSPTGISSVMPSFNFNCINFSNGTFLTSSGQCRETVGNLGITYRISNSTLSNNTGIKVVIDGSLLSTLGRISASLSGILTPWHPNIR